MQATQEIGALGVEGSLEFQDTLLQYLKQGKLHSSFLLAGAEKDQVLAIAKAMGMWIALHHCPQDQNKELLKERITKGVHPDIYIYEDDEPTIKIEIVRELCHQMEVSPIENGAKLCLIQDAHRMTEAAANALLKSLEEPGEKKYFILCSSQPGSLLPTIRSRCVRFTVPPQQENSHEEEVEEFSQALAEFQKTRNTIPLRRIVQHKEKTQKFLNYFQRELHQSVLTGSASFQVSDPLKAYENSLDVESKLRSNVNYALILENYLIECFH